MLRLLGPAGMLVAIAIVRTDRRMVRRLRDAGALSPERAVPVASGNALRRWRLARLVGGGALRREAGDCYYVDEEGWRAYRRRRRVRVAVVLLVLVPLTLLIARLASR